jgi:hypothetical protein
VALAVLTDQVPHLVHQQRLVKVGHVVDPSFREPLVQLPRGIPIMSKVVRTERKCIVGSQDDEDLDILLVPQSQQVSFKLKVLGIYVGEEEDNTVMGHVLQGHQQTWGAVR